MVEFKVGKCPKCGRLAEIIYSNNPLVAGICDKCLKEGIDPSNIKQADFFCRTYNIPFRPDEWIALFEKVGNNVFKIYTKNFYETSDANLYYQSQTKDWWFELNEEWASCVTFEQLLSKIDPIKKKFIERNKIKWGANYEFEDFVQLENLLVSTLRANDITNPLQIDAIKKACKISLELDKAIMEGDSKGIKELSSAYSAFTKTAQIDNVIEAANSDVISTVAELGDFIEKSGGEFTYYDNVDRDIVDKTIKDIKKYVQDLVGDATGLTSQLEAMQLSYKQSVEQQAANDAASALSIEDIIKERTDANSDFDIELDSETLDDIEIEDDDGEY